MRNLAARNFLDPLRISYSGDLLHIKVGELSRLFKMNKANVLSIIMFPTRVKRGFLCKGEDYFIQLASKLQRHLNDRKPC